MVDHLSGATDRIFLIRGLKWLKEQLLGSELLEERGRMILAGRVEQHAKGDPREWPFTASEALDRLIEELQDAVKNVAV